MENLTTEETFLYNQNDATELDKLKVLNSMVDRMLLRRGNCESKFPVTEFSPGKTQKHDKVGVSDVKQFDEICDERSHSEKDHWGAQEYLQSGFHFVNDYLSRSEELLARTASSLRHVSTSCQNTYEVVASSDELLHGSKIGEHQVNGTPVSKTPNTPRCETGIVGGNKEENSVEASLQTHRPETSSLNIDLTVFSPARNITRANEENTLSQELDIVPGENKHHMTSLKQETTIKCHQNISPESKFDDFSRNKDLNIVPVVPMLAFGNLTDCLELNDNNHCENKESPVQSNLVEQVDILPSDSAPQVTKNLDESHETCEPVAGTTQLITKQINNSRPKSPLKFQRKRAPLYFSDVYRTRNHWKLQDKCARKETITARRSTELEHFPAVSMTPRILLLPDELLLHIVSFLPHKDVLTLTAVCRVFHRICNDGSLWRLITIQSSALKDRYLGGIGTRNPRGLELINCDGKQVTNKGLRELFKHLKQSLNYLKVSRCCGDNLTGDNVILHASTYCKNLRQITVPWSNTSDNGLSSAAYGLKMLTHVNISGNAAVTDEAFEILLQQHCNTLQALEIAGCFSLSNEGIRIMCGKWIPRNLQKLNIGLCKVSEDTIASLCAQLPLLHHLDMHGIKAVTDQCMQIIASTCSDINNLNISNCVSVTDKSLFAIADNLNCLRNLNISGCSRATDDGVLHMIPALPLMQHLDTSSTAITHISINSLARTGMHWLTSLKLSFCKNITTDSLVTLLTACSSLQTLHIYGCKRIELEQLVRIRGCVSVKF